MESKQYSPEDKSLTTFCDKWNVFVDRYERGEEKENEALFIELFDILDESVDQKQKPKAVFKQLNTYLAHDLGGFFYNYIYDQIDQGNETYASELLENIHDYIEGDLWFDFLKLRLLQGALVEDATAMMARFIEKLRLKPDVELSIELLYYLIEIGDKELFVGTYKETLKQIHTEDQFVEMLEVIFEYYTLNDLEKEENLIRELIRERKKLPLTQKVLPEDKQKLSSFI